MKSRANSPLTMQAKFYLGEHAAKEFQSIWDEWVSADHESTVMDTARFASFVFSEVPRNFAAGIAVVRDRQGLAGLLPFRFQHSIAGLPTRRLVTWGFGARATGTSLTDIHRAVAKATIARDAAVINFVIPSTLTPGSHEPFKAKGITPLAPKPGYIPLGASWESYLTNQPQKFRRLLRYTVKKAVGQGWTLREREDHSEAIELANQLNDRWQNQHYPQYRGRYRALQRDASLAPHFSGHGLRVFSLERDGHVASVVYGIQHRGRFSLLRQGNAPEFLSISPSTSLRGLVLQQLIPEGIHALDVVGGTEGYWKAEEGPRQMQVLHRPGFIPSVHRLVFDAVAAHKRSRIVTATRAAVARLAPRLAAQAI